MACSSAAAQTSAPAGMITIKPKTPQPMAVGTPIMNPVFPANLEKKQLDKIEFQAPAGVTLLSLEKTVTASDLKPLPTECPESLKLITDGLKQSVDGNVADFTMGKQWIQIDLGESKEIHHLWIWNCHREHPLVYKDIIIQIGDKEDASDGKIVFNNDDDNTSGMGIGKDPAYIESHLGRSIPVAAVKGRYVRLYSKGRNIDDTNQWTEVEVYGK